MSKRDLIFWCISAFLYYSGALHIIHWLHRHSGRRFIILNYHQSARGDLHRHLLYLRKYYRLQFVEHGIEELYNKPARPEKDRRLPLAITFDDGYVDNYTCAYALARKLQIPITIFLSTGYVEKGAAFWWFDNLVEKARVKQITLDGRTYMLGSVDGQYELSRFIDEQVKQRTDKQELEAYLANICELLAVPAVKVDETFTTMLTWKQVEEMLASGLVAFGGHTLHHCTLATLSSIDEAYEEIASCRALLQEKTGRAARVFAYPHGGAEHIGLYGVPAVERAGYQWALTTLQGMNTARTHPYLIRRVSVDAQLPFLLIVLMTSGVWDFLSYWNWLFKRWKYRKSLKEMQLFSIY